MALKDDSVREDEEEALREFLADSECLEPLSEWTRRLNVFDVLKITNTEIRHSNVLAWLMDPAENHGLHDGVIRGFVAFAARRMVDDGGSTTCSWTATVSRSDANGAISTSSP